MDKTGWIVVVICALLLAFYQPVVNHYYPPPKPSPHAEKLVSPQPAPPQPVMHSPTFVLKVDPALKEPLVTTLENNYVAVDFTTAGAGIQHVHLKKYFADHQPGSEPIPLTLHQGYVEPMLNLSGWDSDYNLVGYEITDKTDKSITFRHTLKTGEIVTRKYTLGDAYTIDLDRTVENPGSHPSILPPPTLFVGLGESLHIAQKDRFYVGGSWYTDDVSYSFFSSPFNTHRITEFDPSSFLFIFPRPGRPLITSLPHDKILWAAAKNQFFTDIVTPVGTLGQSVELRKVKLSTAVNGAIPDGVDVRMIMPGVTLSPGGKAQQQYKLYIGPKEYSLLEALGEHQERMMEWGWLAIFCRTLLWIMNQMHLLIPSYGITIILLTITLKAILWYPQSIANRSMKQMQQLNPLIQELQAKYKDNPTKLQEEQLKLFQTYNVSPLGGCLPMFVQFPIFLGFYYMLQSAIELRHSSFLWIADLSQPDTVCTIPLAALIGIHYAIPINPMPLLMTASMLVSVQMTPQTADAANNPMMGVMKFMPLIMLFICYNFSAALSLYWTMQNILSIFQMYVNLRQPVPKLVKVSKKKRKPIWS